MAEIKTFINALLVKNIVTETPVNVVLHTLNFESFKMTTGIPFRKQVREVMLVFFE